MATWKNYIFQCKKKLEKGVNEDKTLQILHKLHKAPMTIELLQETGIGKTIKGMRKNKGEVGEKAKLILADWMQLVAILQGQTKEQSSEKTSKKVHHKTREKQSYDSEDSFVSSYASNHVKYNNYATSKSKKELYNTNYEQKYSDSPEETYDRYDESEPECENENWRSSSGANEQSECGSPEDYNEAVNEEINPDDEDYNYESYDSQQNKRRKHVHSSFHNSTKSSYEEEGSHDKYNDHIKHKKSKPSPLPSGNKASSVEVTNNKLSFQKSHKTDIKVEQKMPSHSKKTVEIASTKVGKQSSHQNNTPKSHQKSEIKHKEKVQDKNKVKSSSSKKTKNNLINMADSEGFTSSIASFEDCLGLNDSVKIRKKKPSSSTNKVSTKPEPSAHVVASSLNKDRSKLKKHGGEKSSGKTDQFPFVPEALQIQKHKLPPLEEVDIFSTLPPIQPNYKPLPHLEPESPPRKKKTGSLTNEEAIMFTSSRKDRTMVYSGRRTIHLSEVPTLYDACIRVLMDNIDGLGFTGGVPFDVLKPVLERCTPLQLYTLEDYNPYLLDDTNGLWKVHCCRDFKKSVPDEDETWREMYLRLFEEREKKLKSITDNISASRDKATPVRRIKLAYVDSVVKPPRDVARRQAKYGTAHTVSHSQKSSQPSKSSRHNTPVASPNAVATASSSIASSSSSAPSVPSAPSAPSLPPKKPKVAPLMQKTLKFMKQFVRR